MIQITIALSLLASTIFFYGKFLKWDPDNKLIVTIRIAIVMLTMDLLTYSCDLMAAFAVKRFFLNFRFVVCCLAFTSGLMIQFSLFNAIHIKGS